MALSNIVAADGVQVPVVILEVHTREVYRGLCDERILLTSYGLQADRVLLAPATYGLAVEGQQAVPFHAAICLELPAGGCYVSGEVVGGEAWPPAVPAGYAT